MIANASADALAQASPDDDTAGLVKRYGDATQIRSFDGDQRTVSEMDALVAYLPILGKLSDAAHKPPVAEKEAPCASSTPRWPFSPNRSGCSTCPRLRPPRSTTPAGPLRRNNARE